MLEKEDLKQITTIFSQSLESTLETVLDAKFDEKLAPIKEKLDNIEFELKEIRDRVKSLEKTEMEDIGAAYRDFEKLKQRVAELELQIRKLQATQQ